LTRSLEVAIAVISLEFTTEIEKVTAFLDNLQLYFKVLVLLF